MRAIRSQHQRESTFRSSGAGARFRSCESRRGTTVVETALVLPVFLLFVLGLIELGHAQMVKHVLRSACRSAARMGTTDGSSTAAVRTKALDVLKSAVDESDVELFVKDASSFDSGAAPPESGSELESLPNIELENAEPRQLFLIRAKIHYNDIAIVPNIPLLGSFLDDVVLEGQAFMRHE
ncbi:MAG: TadE/TadG family type IV pilus assembly protein [Pirellulales bacterium]